MGDFVRAAAVGDVAPGRMKSIRIGAEDVLLYNIAGRIYATADRCAHQNWPLSKGELRGCVIKCDLHLWKFDVPTGEALDNPNAKLKLFEVKVEGDEILVKLE